MKYPKAHLLGIPAEVRLIIWHCVYNDILNDTGERCYYERVHLWSGLSATCSIIHQEVSELWPRTIVPYHRTNFSNRSWDRATRLTNGLAGVLFWKFKHLEMELPIQPEGNARYFYRQVAASLDNLAPVLEDLRIYFLGKERSDTATRYVACGLREYPQSYAFPPRLTFKESLHRERATLFESVQRLSLLRHLTLSNVNYQFQRFQFGNKPWLQELHVTSDPRSQLSLPRRPLPPSLILRRLKSLVISANTVLGAMSMASHLMSTLRKLIVLVPSIHWQNNVEWRWLTDVSWLMVEMAQLGSLLLDFRLCVEGSLQEENAGPLLGAIKLYLPWTKLRVLELHATVYSDYFGSELLAAIPKTLERLYISQELVHVEDLASAVRSRYFGFMNDHHAGLEAGVLAFVGYAFWYQESTAQAILALNAALLDRERNMHLLRMQNTHDQQFGGSITGLRVAEDRIEPLKSTMLGEEAESSEDAPQAALELYQDKSRQHITVGEMIFYYEAPAKARERMQYLITPAIARVREDEHWMAD